MNETKRPVKRIKSFRLTWLQLEVLSIIVRKTGESESVIMGQALSEYFKNHPEYWPPDKKQ